jgi:hypothetical protein
MANAEKGEVDLRVGLKTYTLCFSTNSISEVEQLRDGTAFTDIAIEWMGRKDISTLRLLTFGALRKHHPDLSLFDVGDIIDEIGSSGFEALGAALGEAIRFRFPPAVEPAGE